MNFAFGADQVALREATRDLLRRDCPPEVVRTAWDVPTGQLDRSLWVKLAEMGVLDLLLPERAGGLGLDFCSLVGVLEETGRAALAYPVVETAAVLAPLLRESAGDALISASLGGAPVPFGLDADAILIDDSGTLLLAKPSEVVLEPLATVDRSRRLAAVAAVSVGAAVLSRDRFETEAAFARGAVGTAAQLVGLGQAMLEMTVSYASERRQFGVPIGSFQAVKHHLASALTELEFARPVVYRAAWSLSKGAKSASRDVSMAKAVASGAARLVGRSALQCHGAIGYSFEYDLHLYLKRTEALARSYGDAAYHRGHVATAIGL